MERTLAMRGASGRRRSAGQMSLFHGSMSSDVQAALRRLERTMEQVPEEEMAKRRNRWIQVAGLIDGNISGRRG